MEIVKIMEIINRFVYNKFGNNKYHIFVIGQTNNDP